MKVVTLEHKIFYFNMQYRPIRIQAIWLGGISQYLYRTHNAVSMSVGLAAFRREVIRFYRLSSLEFPTSTTASFHPSTSNFISFYTVGYICVDKKRR
jgi:hypothetical protein